MKIKKRKQRPSMPHHWWLDADGCWFCKNTKGCNNCKANKEVAAAQKKKGEYHLALEYLERLLKSIYNPEGIFQNNKQIHIPNSICSFR